MSMAITLMFISGPEIFIIILVVIILFGSKRIPEIAKGLGKGLREFKKATEDIKREINSSNDDIVKEIKEVRDDIKETTKEVVKNIDASEIGKEIRSFKKNIGRNQN